MTTPYWDEIERAVEVARELFLMGKIRAWTLGVILMWARQEGYRR